MKENVERLKALRARDYPAYLAELKAIERAWLETVDESVIFGGESRSVEECGRWVPVVDGDEIAALDLFNAGGGGLLGKPAKGRIW